MVEIGLRFSAEVAREMKIKIELVHIGDFQRHIPISNSKQLKFTKMVSRYILLKMI